MTDVATISKGF